MTTGRASAPVELSGVQLVDQGTGYLQIRGTATNSNPFEVKNVTVSGVLLDASGQIVSLGSTYALQQDIAPRRLLKKSPCAGFSWDLRTACSGLRTETTMGSTRLVHPFLEQGVFQRPPSASVGFDVRIGKTPHVSYQLYVQAERDWE